VFPNNASRKCDFRLAYTIKDGGRPSMGFTDGFQPSVSSAYLATHHLWCKTLMTIFRLSLPLMWHRLNGWGAAHPTVVCYLAPNPFRSAAPNAKSVVVMIVGKLFER
jgi:hypothetical protein